MKVCVVGGGLIGCATAYQLANQGCEVLLLDAAAEPGTMTSFANGAQLSYSYVEPLASPGTLRGLPAMLLAPESPLKFRLRFDWRQWSWGVRFLLACRQSTARDGTAYLLDLARQSRLVLEGWLSREAWPVHFARNGKLVLCPDAATLRHQEQQVRLQAGMGCRQSVLTAAECLEREPALRAGRARLAGGIWTEDECVADPYLLCRHLVQGLLSRGGRILSNTRVDGFVREGERFVAARAGADDHSADAFVLAAGPQAAALAQGFGLQLPIYPIKGYSITLNMASHPRPTVSVTDLGRKTVFAPLGSQLRVAAMAEIVGYDLRIPADRVQAMLSSVEALYPGLCDTRDPRPWAGLRPATPTSRPLLGRLRASNMYLNVGHGALGLTLAAGSAARVTAELLADLG